MARLAPSPLGSGALMRQKRPAALNIGIDRDRAALDQGARRLMPRERGSANDNYSRLPAPLRHSLIEPLAAAIPNSVRIAPLRVEASERAQRLWIQDLGGGADRGAAIEVGGGAPELPGGRRATDLLQSPAAGLDKAGCSAFTSCAARRAASACPLASELHCHVGWKPAAE